MMSSMQSEVYTPGHSESSISFMERRSLDSHASFLRPYLQRGMKILDCGCGTGTITLGVAKAISPGKVWGIDEGAEEINRATKRAMTENISIGFQLGDIYNMPFEDGFFDGVYAHALFEHLSKPLEALKNIKRVLKPSGFVALRSPDWGGFVLEPWNVLIAQAVDSYLTLLSSNGGDAYTGRKLAGYLRKSGFAEVSVSASYEIYSDPKMIAEYLAAQLDLSGEASAAKVLREWSRNPDAMFAQSWFEVIARNS